MMNSQGWEEIDHTADWSIRVWGPDLRTLFELAAQGMITLIEGESGKRTALVEQTFTLQAPDLETLLVDWLNELVYLVEDENVLLKNIDVKRVSNLTLNAEISGVAAGEFDKHIKAVTYHGLEIVETSIGYEATLVFDV